MSEKCSTCQLHEETRKLLLSEIEFKNREIANLLEIAGRKTKPWNPDETPEHDMVSLESAPSLDSIRKDLEDASRNRRDLRTNPDA